MKDRTLISRFSRIFTLTLLAQVLLHAQPIQNIERYIEDPAMIGENKEDPTVLLVPYADAGQAALRDPDASPFFRSLDGTWKFGFRINPSLAPKDFFVPAYDDAGWDDIPVPSNWQTEGYDRLIYRNVPMEFTPYDPPHVPDDINPTGLYRRWFDVPGEWNGRRIYLHFEGMQSAGFVWVNGKYVGYHEDGMTAAEFDVTAKLQPGRNLVAVMVLRWCDGSYLEDQDMFRFSGIYRNIFLYAKPSVMIRDVFLVPKLRDDYTDATLEARLFLKNTSRSARNVAVRMTLKDQAGTTVSDVTSPAVSLTATDSLRVSMDVMGPRLWSDEVPDLYTVILELLDGQGNVIETVSQRTGFRSLEVRNGVALLNGMPLTIRGTNRHEHDMRTGKTITRERMLEDIRLLKQFNLNAVRTSHYPNDPEWYELCDEYGILLQDEVNAECHYTEYTFPKRKDYLASFMDRFVRMMERDKNHPSVVMWSTGNECGLAEPHYMMADYMRRTDPTRFLMHQSNTPDGEAPYVDIVGPRYPTPSGLRQIGERTDKPVVMGEYAHAMGTSLGHHDEFWDAISDVPSLQGGFIWDWVDQGMMVPARYVRDASPNGIQCAVMGRPDLIEGGMGMALRLSGLDDWVEVYDDPRLNPSRAFSIEARIHPGKFYTENPIVTKGYQYGVTLFAKDSLRFYLNGYRNSLQARVPPDWGKGWHTIRASFDGATMSISVDGQVLGTRPYDRAIRETHYPVNIGRDAYRNTDGQPGWISNFDVDNVTLSIENATALSLGFDEIIEGDEYITFGISPFCHNGIISADRTVQPELWQVKHSEAPIRYTAADPSSGHIRVWNMHSFRDLGEFDHAWKLMVDGHAIDSGSIRIEGRPQTYADIVLPVRIPRVGAGTMVLEVRSMVRSEEPTRPAGHEINMRQFVLSRPAPVLPPIREQQPLSLKTLPDRIQVTAGAHAYSIDTQTGDLGYARDGKMVFQGLNANVWRAPVSNERVISWGKGEAEDWYRIGLNRPEPMVDSIEIQEDNKDAVKRVILHTRTLYKKSGDHIGNTFSYTFRQDGTVLLDHTMVPLGGFEVSWLPAVGVSFTMDQSLDNRRWFGRGPFETYNDRSTGARLGVFSAVISEARSPYAEPQEFGNTTETSWVEFVDGIGRGIRFSASEPMDVCAVPYSNLDRAMYTFQLRSDGFHHVDLSYRKTGVGDTPNPVMPAYRVYPEPIGRTLFIIPLDPVTQ